MLALQRPSMGSSKPSSHRDMPFGYDFDATNDFPFPPPPAPAPGPSLLDDADSKLLGDFFDGVSSDHFNGNDFFDKALGMSGTGGYDLPFGWTDLPPTFMGTSSSFGGVQQQSSHGIPDNNFGLMGNEIPAVTSADVLAAATILGGQNPNFHDDLGNDIMAAQDISRTLQTGPSLINRSRASMAPFTVSRGTPASTTLPPKDDFLHNSFLTDMAFTHANAPTKQSKAEDVQWGSDFRFGASSFRAPPGQEPEKRIERYIQEQLDCGLEIPSQPSSSTNTTQPSSPAITRSDTIKNRRPSPQHEEEAYSNFQPRKRRKSTATTIIKTEDDEEDETPKPRKRKQSTSKSTSNDTTQPSTGGSKRRKLPHIKSSGNSSDSKTKSSARENLTEDQKRENHIRSEQKRRTLIKEGFEDLGELVPELGGGGFSKSAVLLMAGDWLEDLVKGNEVLREQLAMLEGRNGLG